jgi:hypothetical protein
VTKPAAKTPAIPIKVKKAMINTSRFENISKGLFINESKLIK